ncbi:tryptophan-rich sensory protein [Patescibacteria group bacterium]|nr:tryptophan-rich sensory protein [Patescibacteria group bacterium]
MHIKSKPLKFIISIVVCQMAGVIGSLFTAPAINTWYATLQRPFFAPPNWIFGPVWITLFFLMGIAAYLVWIKWPENKNSKTALIIFDIHLVLNILWSFLFFKLQNPFYAFIEIIVLWVFILITIILFCKISKPAGLLLIPYILWVSFAGVLNYSFWQLNNLSKTETSITQTPAGNDLIILLNTMTLWK